MDLLNRHYKAIKARGLITTETDILDFQTKLHEEVKEFDKEVKKYMFNEGNNLAQESIDVISVLFNMLKHLGFDVHFEHEKNVITQEIRAGIKSGVSFSSIECLVLACTNIKKEVVYVRTRKREIVEARQLIQYYAKKYHIASLSKIGELTGGYDHATVLHSYKAISILKENDHRIKRLISEIESMM